MKKIKIHFWVPYPEHSAPSQRFRVEQYLPYLPQEKFSFSIFSFLDTDTWKVFYNKGNKVKKFYGLIMGYFRRIRHLILSPDADYIFILREAASVGPPVFEWLLAKVFKKKIIYDFDDAIWIPGGEKAGKGKKFLKATWKVKHIIRWSYKVSCGNEFLCAYSRQYNKNVFLMPTVIDTNKSKDWQKISKKEKRVVVGWTGSHTTLHNLEEIESLIPILKNEIDFDLLIISNKPPDCKFDFIFKKWAEATEAEDLLKMDIGIMPLKKGPWFEGKCGFKLIQYHSFGIPAIASNVGVNSSVTLHNKTGFIASDKDEWKSYFKKLIADASLRSTMGEAAREHIEKNYSLHNLLPAFVSLFS
ncbi:MAG: glycosyltransferase family 4 protein [Bacteroidetes bacterium]|nr:MAG: glycosyltransferase family 4 protein [Bacteroidota bacterium]